MQAATNVAVSRNVIRYLLAVVVVAVGASHGSVYSARAQASPPSADGPPIAIGGWRYEKGASDIHLFICEKGACVPGSRVSYRIYTPGTTMSLDQFRREQDVVLKALQQRAPPGTKMTIVGVEGDDGGTLPRMYKVRRLTVAPDGTQEHVHSGVLIGTNASVSLISSALDEKSANGGYAQFALGLMLFIQTPRDPQK